MRDRPIEQSRDNSRVRCEVEEETRPRRHTCRMLDRQIDKMYAQQGGGRWSIFSKFGAIFNVVVCGVITIGALLGGFSGQPFAFIVAIFGIVMETIFARTLFRVLRGDFAVTAETDRP